MSNTRKPATAKERIKGARRQRHSTRINLRGDIVADIERLEADLEDIVEVERQSGGNRRLAQGKPLSAVTAAEIEAKRAEMSDEWLDIVLEQQGWVAWREFRAASPPRAGDAYDKLVGCDFDKLAHDFLPGCVVEPELDAEDWAGIFEKCSPADIRDLAALVFTLHEQGLVVPKSRLAESVLARVAVDAEVAKVRV